MDVWKDEFKMKMILNWKKAMNLDASLQMGKKKIQLIITEFSMKK